MKYLKKYLLIVALFIGAGFYMNAQDVECTPEEMEEIVCVDFGQDFIIPISVCEFNQIAQEENTPFELTIVDCPDDWNGNDDDWEDDWDDEDQNEFDCDCFNDEPVFVCVDLGDGFPFPITECEIECFGEEFGDFEIVECDEDWGDNWDDEDQNEFDCDCFNDEPVFVCVDLGDGFPFTITECEIECFGEEFGDFEIVECDEDWGDDWNDDDQEEFDCDCLNDEPVFVCVDFGDGFAFPISECEIECFGVQFGDFEIVECDEDWNEEDWGDDWDNENPCDSIPPFDCDCFNDEPVFICVDLGDGFPFTITECEIECFGEQFGDFEIVECNDDWNDDNEIPNELPFDCDCEQDDVFDVCVEIEEGFIIPMSQCLFDCISEYEALSVVDCDGLGGNDDDGQGDFIGNGGQVEYALESITLYPNPSVDDNIFVTLTSNVSGTVNVEIINLIGQNVYSQTLELNAGTNKIEMNISDFEKGFYTVMLKSNDKIILTERLIRD